MFHLCKKFSLILALTCFVFTQVKAVEYPYDPLPEPDRPKTQVRVPFKQHSDITIPPELSKGGVFGRFEEIRANPIYMDIEIEFSPRAVLPAVVVPTGFPLDLNTIVGEFLFALVQGGNLKSFLTKNSQKLDSISGKIVNDAFVEEEGSRRVIGHQTLSPLWKPSELLTHLDGAIKAVRKSGLFFLFEHNQGLLSVLRTILTHDLEQKSFKDVEYGNIYNIAEIFQAAGAGSLRKKGNEFVLGQNLLAISQDDEPRAMILKVRSFMNGVFSTEVLGELQRLGLQASALSPQQPAAAADRSEEVSELPLGDEASKDVSSIAVAGASGTRGTEVDTVSAEALGGSLERREQDDERDASSPHEARAVSGVSGDTGIREGKASEDFGDSPSLPHGAGAASDLSAAVVLGSPASEVLEESEGQVAGVRSVHGSTGAPSRVTAASDDTREEVVQVLREQDGDGSSFSPLQEAPAALSDSQPQRTLRERSPKKGQKDGENKEDEEVGSANTGKCTLI